MAHVPGMEQILKLRARGLLGCALSGAGPGILVFYDEGSEAVLDMVRAEFDKVGKPSEIVARGVSEKGLEIK